MGDFLIPGLLAGAQTVFGIGQQIAAGGQRRKAQKFFDKNKYEIPSGINQMLDTVRGVASQREMPGSDVMRQQLQGTTSQGVETATRAATSSSDVLGALQGLYGRQMKGQQNMAIANAQNWQRNQMQLANSLQTLGNYQTQKWNYNVLYPYMQKMTAAGQMAQAGNENIASGINSGLNLWGANQQMNQQQNMFDQWLNNRGWNNQTVANQQVAPEPFSYAEFEKNFL